MSLVERTFFIGDNSRLNFGNFEEIEKIKINDFKNGGDLYYLRSHNQMTRVRKNGALLFESVPGTVVTNFSIDEKKVTFEISGFENTQMTLELEPNQEYRILIDDLNVGSTLTNISGKVNFSENLAKEPKKIVVEKVL